MYCLKAYMQIFDRARYVWSLACTFKAKYSFQQIFSSIIKKVGQVALNGLPVPSTCILLPVSDNFPA